MNEPLFVPGQLEAVKFAVHLVLFGASAIAFAYNVASWAARKEPHLAINAGVYGAVAVYEIPQLFHHGGTQ